MWLTLLLAVVANLVIGQIIYPGRCNVKKEQVRRFVDPLSLLGFWYQQGRIRNDVESGNCSTTFFYVINRQQTAVVNKEIVDGKIKVMMGTVDGSFDGGMSTLKMSFENNTPETYHVLATDYDNYVLFYRCLNVANNSRSVVAWLMTRSREESPSLETIRELAAATDRNPDINSTSWEVVHHHNCSNFSMLGI